jgi:ADP-heptose:LPS heptosyltransferase
VLVVRTDRVGDVLLTTPVSTALREAFPRAGISWLVRAYTAPLLEHNPDVDQVLVDDGGPVAALAARIGRERFDVAIVALPRGRIAWALWRAGVPTRIGPASKLSSLLFTKRVWQHRSEGKKHEADYNLELLGALGVPFKRHPTRLVLTDAETREARALLVSRGVGFSKPLVILHPGSGGSSARWPPGHFAALGDRLQAGGCEAIVTAGPGEDFQDAMTATMERPPLFLPPGSLGLRGLAAVISCADLLATNSTGPLHLAVALGVPTVSVFSPMPTCHPTRWGPYPAYVEGSGTHRVFLAPGAGKRATTGEDMAAVSVDEVYRGCREILSGKLAGGTAA